ncbi:hypothetical protein BDZ89DRAFT_1063363 [Hymenopellis radicata]|nr:hypothetical protein BDZ89DRAFT_1063363 [Hymenopellis radicata]
MDPSDCCACCCCCVCIASAFGRIPCLAGCFTGKKAKDVEDDDEIVYPMADTNQPYHRPDRMRPPDPNHPPNGPSYPRNALPNASRLSDGGNYPARDVRSPPPPYGVNSPSMHDGHNRGPSGQEGHGRSPSAQGPPRSLQPGHPPQARSPSSERAH